MALHPPVIQPDASPSLKHLRLMMAFFGSAPALRAQPIAPEAMPALARDLLVHHGHMTEKLESVYQTVVDVFPYDIHQSGQMYGRKLDLRCRQSGRVLMTGLMIIHLQAVSAAVREEILAAQLPLGRILIHHGVLREVVSEAYLVWDDTDPLAQRVLPAGPGGPGQPTDAERESGASVPYKAYGRLATIWCDGQPAVDLLELVSVPDDHLRVTSV